MKFRLSQTQDVASQQSLIKDMWRHPDHVTGAHRCFYSHSLEVRPLHSRVVAHDCQVFLLFPTLSPLR